MSETRPIIMVRRAVEESIDLADLEDDIWEKLLTEVLKTAEVNLQFWGDRITIYNEWEDGKFGVKLADITMGLLEDYGLCNKNPGDLKHYLRDTKKTLTALKKSAAMLERVIELGSDRLERFKARKRK